jgi:Na+-translocating ferredoxin:NAD+ oxidoreductase RNF subunit RnfB
VTNTGTQNIKKIYELLPKLNCGLCGFENCGQFAKAIAKKQASPFGCRQNPWLGYKLSEIMGIQVPAYGYGWQTAFSAKQGGTLAPEVLIKEVQGLSQKADDIVARIEALRAKIANT